MVQVFLKNKALEKYLSKSFNISTNLTIDEYSGRWIDYKGILLPNLASKEFNSFVFVDEILIEPKVELEEGKLYFLGDFEGVYFKDERFIAKSRFLYELFYIRYFIVVKGKNIVGVIKSLNNYQKQIADYVFLDTDEKPKLFKHKEFVYDLKKKFLHILKMSEILVEEEMFIRLEETIR